MYDQPISIWFLHKAAGDGPPSEAVVVAVTNGRLDFGAWERIVNGEFDGRCRKRVLVKIVGDLSPSVSPGRTHNLLSQATLTFVVS